ncbi:MAG: hypothetical protein WC718_04680 [Phycisphaerales bacterium]|jgi:hypothetical protein
MNFKMCALSVVVLAGGVANAGMLLKPGGNWPGGSEFAMTGNVKVRSYAPNYATTAGAAGLSEALQQQTFQWDFQGSTTGNFRLDQNTAWAVNEPAQNFYGYNFPAANRPDTVGNAFAVGYIPGAGDPAIANVRWLQVIRTNTPLQWGIDRGTSISGDDGFTWYIDNGWSGQPVPPTDPFYGADDNNNATGYAANGRGLIDSPSRDAQAGIVWEAWAFASTRANGSITIYDGVHWGWETTAVPTPGSLALMGVGSVLAFRRKR